MRIRKRKNLKVLRGKNRTVVIAAGRPHFDAAALLFHWLDVRRAAGISDRRLLFCHAGGGAISAKEVMHCMVWRVMQAVGRNPATIYGGHTPCG